MIQDSWFGYQQDYIEGGKAKALDLVPLIKGLHFSFEITKFLKGLLNLTDPLVGAPSQSGPPKPRVLLIVWQIHIPYV